MDEKSKCVRMRACSINRRDASEAPHHIAIVWQSQLEGEPVDKHGRDDSGAGGCSVRYYTQRAPSERGNERGRSRCRASSPSLTLSFYFSFFSLHSHPLLISFGPHPKASLTLLLHRFWHLSQLDLLSLVQNQHIIHFNNVGRSSSARCNSCCSST